VHGAPHFHAETTQPTVKRYEPAGSGVTSTQPSESSTKPSRW
jgi:hypothetical protein